MKRGAYIANMDFSYLNVRKEPGGEIVGRLEKSGVVIALDDNEAVSGSYSWVRVHIPMNYANGVNHGWIALVPHLRFEPAARLDMWRYLSGVAPGQQRQHVHAMQSGEMIQVTAPETGSLFYHVKGHAVGVPNNYEAFGFDNDFIYRYYDSSPYESGRMYVNNPVVKGGAVVMIAGVKWLYRFMRPGQVISYPLKVGWFNEQTGRLVELRDGNGNPQPNPTPFTHMIQLVAIHNTYTFPSGVELNDVAEIRSFWPAGNGKPEEPFERYWYAAGHGLVGWRDEKHHTSRHNYVSLLNIPGKHIKQTIDWLPEITDPGGIIFVDNQNEEPPEMPTFQKHYNMENAGFAGDPVKAIKPPDRPGGEIIIATPRSWQIGYEVNTDRHEENVSPMIVNDPGGGGWKFEPAWSQMVAWAYQSNRRLEPGFYQVDVSMWADNVPDTDREKWAFSLYLKIEGKIYSHWHNDRVMPRFNLADHTVPALGNKQARFWFEVTTAVNVDEIGFMFTTDYAQEQGAFLVSHADVYKTVEGVVDSARLLLEVNATGVVPIAPPAVDPPAEPGEPVPPPIDPPHSDGAFWHELTTTESTMAFVAREYANTPWGDPAHNWIVLVNRLVTLLEAQGMTPPPDNLE